MNEDRLTEDEPDLGTSEVGSRAWQWVLITHMSASAIAGLMQLAAVMANDIDGRRRDLVNSSVKATTRWIMAPQLTATLILSILDVILRMANNAIGQSIGALRPRPGMCKRVMLGIVLGIAAVGSLGDTRAATGELNELMIQRGKADWLMATQKSVTVMIPPTKSRLEKNMANCSNKVAMMADREEAAPDADLMAGTARQRQWLEERVHNQQMDATMAHAVEWSLMDSGSSEVYVPSDYQLTEGQACDKDDLVHTADGVVLPLEKGTWHCLWQEHEGEWCEIEHANAVRMPGFTRVLVSVGKLISECECEVTLGKKEAYLKTKDKTARFDFMPAAAPSYTYAMPFVPMEAVDVIGVEGENDMVEDLNTAEVEEQGAYAVSRMESGHVKKTYTRELAEVGMCWCGQCTKERPEKRRDAAKAAVEDETGAIWSRSEEDVSEVTDAHLNRGAQLPAIRGLGLPKVMRDRSWFAHLCFSHLGGAKLEAGAKNCMTHLNGEGGKEIVKGSGMCDCEVCAEANAVRLHSSLTAPREGCEWGHLCADVVGPMPLSWIDGHVYGLIVVDMSTRYKWFFPMKKKSEVPEKMKALQRKIQRMDRWCVANGHGPRPFLSMRLDGDGSHRSDALKKWFIDENIHLIESRPYESNSNGTAERAIRTMCNCTRANLLQGDCDEGGWVHASQHATRTLNMLPEPGFDAHTSPYMGAWGVKPRGDDVRPFGSLSILTNNSAVKGSKVSPRGERCFHAGTCDEEHGDDDEVGKSRCFKLICGRRNKPVYSTNVVNFPGHFQGVPDTLATRSLRDKGPRADQSEEIGIGNRKPTRNVKTESTEETSQKQSPPRRKATKVVGESFVVPASLWNVGGEEVYECKEHDGVGWEVTVIKREGNFSKCRWRHARDTDGTPWAPELIETKRLIRLDEDGRVPEAYRGSAAAAWRVGTLSDTMDDRDGIEASWGIEDAIEADEAERVALAAMNESVRVSQETVSKLHNVTNDQQQQNESEQEIVKASMDRNQANPKKVLRLAAALKLEGAEGQRVRDAINAELQTAIDDFGCLKPVLATDQSVAGHKIFRIGMGIVNKQADSLKPARCKARMFLMGCDEVEGEDYVECTSTVQRLTGFNVCCAIVANHPNCIFEHSDMTGAFLHEKNPKKILARLPDGLRTYRYVNGEKVEEYYWVDNLYGRHDAGRVFMKAHRKYFLDRGFVATTPEPCIFIKRYANGDFVIASMYVDDVAWIASNEKVMDVERKAYKTKYIAEFAACTGFLGTTIERNKSDGVVRTHQKQQIEKIVAKWLPEESKLRSKPADRPCDEKLISLVSPAARTTYEECDPKLKTAYQSLLGELLYVCLSRRGDALYAVIMLGRCASNPTEELFMRLLLVVSYLHGDSERALEYRQSAGLVLSAFSDASFESWGATTGLAIFLAGASVCMMSKRQRCVTLSTCEAELVALSMCAAEVIYFRILLEELGFEQLRPTEINVDNTAARQVAMEPVLSSEMKHVRRRHYFARQMQEVGEIVVNWVDTKFNWADALTKALPAAKHREMTSQFMKLHNASERARPDAAAALAMVGEMMNQGPAT